MTEKQFVIDVINRLPETSTISDIQEEVEVLAALQQGEEDIAKGRVYSHEEVKALFTSWNFG